MKFIGRLIKILQYHIPRGTDGVRYYQIVFFCKTYAYNLIAYLILTENLKFIV